MTIQNDTKQVFGDNVTDIIRSAYQLGLKHDNESNNYYLHDSSIYKPLLEYIDDTIEQPFKQIAKDMYHLGASKDKVIFGEKVHCDRLYGIMERHNRDIIGVSGIDLDKDI